MADLNPLIRVRKHAIEQKQKFLAELFRQADELANGKESLLTQMADEKRRAFDMGPEMLAFFGHYAEAVKTRVDEIDESLARLEIRIEAAQDDIREAYADLKQIEIIQERRDEEAADLILKKENDMLDEIGIDGFRRRAEEDE
ncbi:MAG: flagellar FliJ family protein [Alphaproteobacteria bacterium]|nr:flagellar FliJ family protein [Alphaproteobacteria bacterium]